MLDASKLIKLLSVFIFPSKMLVYTLLFSNELKVWVVENHNLFYLSEWLPVRVTEKSGCMRSSGW